MPRIGWRGCDFTGLACVSFIIGHTWSDIFDCWCHRPGPRNLCRIIRSRHWGFIAAKPLWRLLDDWTNTVEAAVLEGKLRGFSQHEIESYSQSQH
jgi:hypothetical protein